MNTDNFWGKLLGFPGLLACIGLLIWNEYHHVHINRLLDEVRDALITVTDTTRVNPENEGKLLYFNADTHVGKPTHDPLYGFGGNYLSVSRRVEYFQWKEEKHTERYTDRDGEEQTRTYYTYDRQWCDKPIDSSNFHDGSHQNSVLADVESHKTYSNKARLGPYILDWSLIDSLPPAQPPASLLDTLSAQFHKAIDSTTFNGRVKYHIERNMIYYGRNPEKPSVGDVRLFIHFTPDTHAWCMAQARGDSLCPFRASDGYWFTFQRMRAAEMNPKQEIESEQWGQNMLAMSLRIVGWLLLVRCFKAVFESITGLVRGIPLLGFVVEGLGSVAAWILGTVTALTVIGLSFVFLRPLLGVSLLALVAAFLGFMAWNKKRRQAVAAPQSVPSQTIPQASPQVPPPLPSANDSSSPTPPPLPGQ